MDHPSEETLRRFAAGTASREESRGVVGHLLKSCAACAGRIARLMEPASVAGASYEAALERFDERMLQGLEEAVEPLPFPPSRPSSQGPRHPRGPREEE